MAARFFGEYLLIQGLIEQKTLDQVLEIQQRCNLMLGELAISQGLLSEQDTLEINLRQQIENKRFGNIAKELGLLDEQQLQNLLQLQKKQHKFFGDILVEFGIFNQQELASHLAAHHKKNKQAEHFLQNELNNHVLGEYLIAIIETTNRLFLRTLHQQSQFSQLLPSHNDIKSAPISCQISLSSEQEVSISMLTSLDTASQIASSFTMMPIEECDLEFSNDAFGEFLNIIVGHLIDETDKDIPSDRSATRLNINIDELCNDSEQLLLAEIDTQIGNIYIIISS